MDQAIDVRPIIDDEVPAWCGALNTGFLSAAGDIDAEARRAGIDLDRTWGAFDSAYPARVVATYRSFATEITVSGQESSGGARLVSASAITAVSTTATHRRRGLLNRMMSGDLQASKERGEVVAVLIAADYPIYGRYGFGPATDAVKLTVRTKDTTLGVPAVGTVELIDDAMARAVQPQLFDQQRRRRAGDLAQPDRFWDLDYGIIRMPSWPEPKKFLNLLARDATGAPVGLARFRYEEKFIENRPAGTIFVEAFTAATAAAEIRMWDYLISLDWPDTVVAELRAVDELLPWVLTDGRRAVASDRSDHLWLRPIDVPALLSARAYSAAVSAVIEVVDPMGLSGGRFRLDTPGSGAPAECRPSTASADLTMDLGTLGAISLGGRSLTTLAAAGRVEESTTAAISHLDAAFHTPVAPWCSFMF